MALIYLMLALQALMLTTKEIKNNEILIQNIGDIFYAQLIEQKFYLVASRAGVIATLGENGNIMERYSPLAYHRLADIECIGVKCLLTFIEPVAVQEWNIKEFRILRTLYSTELHNDSDIEARYVEYKSNISVLIKTSKFIEVIQSKQVFKYESR